MFPDGPVRGIRWKFVTIQMEPPDAVGPVEADSRATTPCHRKPNLGSRQLILRTVDIENLGCSGSPSRSNSQDRGHVPRARAGDRGHITQYLLRNIYFFRQASITDLP